MIGNFLRRFTTSHSPPESKSQPKNSYSQCGEDLIMDFYCKSMARRPILSYLDIGAHHPFWINNTAIFYEQGVRGVCVDPSEDSRNLFREMRPHDLFLKAAVGAETEKGGTLYVMDEPALTTMNKAEADSYVREKGHQLIREESVDVISLDDLIDQQFDGVGPTIMNLDIEGIEYDVMSSFSYAGRSPYIICAETIGYVSQKHNESLIELITGNGYQVLARTPINTIFVREDDRLTNTPN